MANNTRIDNSDRTTNPDKSGGKNCGEKLGFQTLSASPLYFLISLMAVLVPVLYGYSASPDRISNPGAAKQLYAQTDDSYSAPSDEQTPVDSYSPPPEEQAAPVDSYSAPSDGQTPVDDFADEEDIGGSE